MAAAPDNSPEAETRTLTLVLVRHGETAWNREGRSQGWQNVPLSEAGRQQARSVAARLAQTWQANNPARAFIPGPPRAFYASDLSRALDTARAIADHVAPLTGGILPVEPLSDLRERNFGEREGFTADEARAKWGSEANYEAVSETYAHINERMTAALQTIWDAHTATASTGENVVLVAGHGGSLRLWLCRAVGLGPEGVHHFHLDNTSLSIVRFSGPTLEQSASRLLLCNDSAHLQSPPVPNNGGRGAS